MEPLPQAIPFDEWTQSADVLCRRHLVCSWHDLCGEVQPLERAYDMGDTPLRFVEWWAEQYDLIWVDPENKLQWWL